MKFYLFSSYTICLITKEYNIYVKYIINLNRPKSHTERKKSALHNVIPLLFQLTYCDGGAIFSDTTGENDGYAALCK